MVLTENPAPELHIEILELVDLGRCDTLFRYPGNLRNHPLNVPRRDDPCSLFILSPVHAGVRSRLVDHIDRLVGKMSFVNVLAGKLRSRPERLVIEAHFMILLVPVLNAKKDAVGLLRGRLGDFYLLKAAGQRMVAVKVLAVLLVGRGAYAAKLPPGQRGLEDVRCIHRPARNRPRTDDCVDLVDKEDRIVDLMELPQHLLQTVLEIAAVLCSGEKRPHVERIDLRAAQRLGDGPFRHKLRKAFGDCRFSYARIAHMHRIVLEPPAEHLYGPLDNVLPPDERVHFAPRGLCHKLDCEHFKHAFLSLLLPGRLLFILIVLLRSRANKHVAFVRDGRNAVRDVIQYIQPGDALPGKEIRREGILFLEQRYQHIAYVKIILLRRRGVPDRLFHHVLKLHRLQRFPVMNCGNLIFKVLLDVLFKRLDVSTAVLYDGPPHVRKQ